MLVENALMFPRGLVSYQDLLDSIDALRRHLSSLKFMYTVLPAEIDLSSNLESVYRMISREFAW